MFSGFAGAFNCLFDVAFLRAIKADIANINGGSPTAFDLLTTFSLFLPFL